MLLLFNTITTFILKILSDNCKNNSLFLITANLHPLCSFDAIIEITLMHIILSFLYLNRNWMFLSDRSWFTPLLLPWTSVFIDLTGNFLIAMTVDYNKSYHNAHTFQKKSENRRQHMLKVLTTIERWCLLAVCEVN